MGGCFYRDQKENDKHGWLYELGPQAGGCELPLGCGCLSAGTDHTYSMKNACFKHEHEL